LIKRQYLVVLTLCVLLGACKGSPFYYDMLKSQVQKRIETECPAKVKGAAADRLRCQRRIVLEAYAQDPSLPILMKYAEKAISVAVEYDKGRISEKIYLAKIEDININQQVEMNQFYQRYNAQQNILSNQYYFQNRALDIEEQKVDAIRAQNVQIPRATSSITNCSSDFNGGFNCITH
jgi:hypothetical protein